MGAKVRVRCADFPNKSMHPVGIFDPFDLRQAQRLRTAGNIHGIRADPANGVTDVSRVQSTTQNDLIPELFWNA